jgi:hypothetical protein
MASSQRHRGAHPEDLRLFHASQLPRIFAAAVEVSYLLSRGYPPDPAFSFVGGHHQLHARQRLALRRIACSDAQKTVRGQQLLPIARAASGTLHIDGLNLIITLEVALSGGPLFRGRDGALRDLAGLRGSYHPVEETEEALRLVGECLTTLAAPAVAFYLDAPVANSGRLRARILEHAASWPFPVEVTLLPDADKALLGKDRVVSADGAVLDGCGSWLNLSSFLIERALPRTWIIADDSRA